MSENETLDNFWKGTNHETRGRQFENLLKENDVSKFRRCVFHETRWSDDTETLCRVWYIEENNFEIAVGVEMIRDTHVRYYVKRSELDSDYKDAINEEFQRVL